MQASSLFSTPSEATLSSFFDLNAPAWQWVPQIAKALATLGGKSFIHPTARIHPTAVIEEPVYIGPRVVVGPFAYVRQNVIALEGAVLGHAGEFKNCLIMENAELAHYNYVGDSVIGRKAHLGAGVICSNLRLDKNQVRVAGELTGLIKFGALVGEGAQVGCNAVLNPGTVISPARAVAPLTAVRGVVK